MGKIRDYELREEFAGDETFVVETDDGTRSLDVTAVQNYIDDTVTNVATDLDEKYADAAENCNAAAENANAVAESAQEAANEALQATVGAEKVNISAEQTLTGATVTVTDRDGEETSVHIDTLMAVDSWIYIQNAVRLGLGESLFPVGYEFYTTDAVTGNTVIWVVVAHNHHAAANSRLTYSMTLECKYLYSVVSSGARTTFAMNPAQALYYAADGLSAGTYCFTYDATVGSMTAGTYQFTLTEDIPSGGQIVLNTTGSKAITDCTISTYESPESTTAIESDIEVTEGSDGTSLGTVTTATTDENLNNANRICWGSNNYAQSALRQFLNSDAEAGAVWTPQTVFDRPPSWHTNASYAGFMATLPEDFLAVVETAVVPCRTNNIFEVASIDGTEYPTTSVYNLEDKFFILSQGEIYGTYQNGSYKDGTLLDYYDGLTNTERIKYDSVGTAYNVFMRTPHASGGSNMIGIGSSAGATYYPYSSTALAIAPACIIA